MKEIEKSGTDRVTDNKRMENILRKTYNDKYIVQNGAIYEYMESNNTQIIVDSARAVQIVKVEVRILWVENQMMIQLN